MITITCPDGSTTTLATDDTLAALASSLAAAYASSVLRYECCVGDALTGTGTKTTLGTLVTALHVAARSEASALYSGDVYVRGGGNLAQLGDRDLLELSEVGWNAAGAALPGVARTLDAAPRLGELVACMSYPLDLLADVQLTTGHVADTDVSDSLAPENEALWRGAFTADYAAAAGSSGAPVFDGAGRRIGVHVGGYGAGGLNIHFALAF